MHSACMQVITHAHARMYVITYAYACMYVITYAHACILALADPPAVRAVFMHMHAHLP